MLSGPLNLSGKHLEWIISELTCIFICNKYSLEAGLGAPGAVKVVGIVVAGEASSAESEGVVAHLINIDYSLIL